MHGWSLAIVGVHGRSLVCVGVASMHGWLVGLLLHVKSLSCRSAEANREMGVLTIKNNNE